MESISVVDLSYIAGFVDGEGCISLRCFTGKRGYQEIRNSLAIVNTNRKVLEWIKVKLSCGAVYDITGKRENQKSVFVYEVCDRVKLLYILKLLLPYLKVKKEQAELCVVFLEEHLPRSKFTDEEYEMVWFMQKLKE